MEKRVKRHPLSATHSGPRPGHFRLGSLESRAAARSMLRALAEEANRPVFGARCICFPEDEQPPGLSDEAASLQCPLHGKRFTEPLPFQIYQAKWRHDREWKDDFPHHSRQYAKAMRASFPSGYSPEPESKFAIYEYSTGLPVTGDARADSTKSAIEPPAAMSSKPDEMLISEAARREEIVVEIEPDSGTSTTRTPSEIEITISDRKPQDSKGGSM